LILKWLPTAKQDFEDIVEYIATDNPIAAIEQGDEIEKQLFLLISYPKMGRPGRVKGTRELVIVRTPYIQRKNHSNLACAARCTAVAKALIALICINSRVLICQYFLSVDFLIPILAAIFHMGIIVLKPALS
jgi:toxin ParE1/3/4